jgi:hypothetical protein
MLFYAIDFNESYSITRTIAKERRRDMVKEVVLLECGYSGKNFYSHFPDPLDLSNNIFLNKKNIHPKKLFYEFYKTR